MYYTEGEKMKNTTLQWHPAFSAALRITLQDELEYLEMWEEYLLSKKPLQMDILIIKKLKDVPIRENDWTDISET